MASPFETLGVEPDADRETVERAYRRRVKESHPDRGGSAEEFRRVREAYEAALAATAPTDADAEASGATGSEGDADVDAADAPARSSRPTGDRRATATDGRRGADDTDEPVQSRVEYLSYDAVEDNGWTLTDDDLFERAAGADLSHRDHGRFLADTDELLLEAAEAQGYVWPFACRGGACANCAVYVAEGTVETTVDHVLSDELHAAGFRLSCICKPVSERLRVVYDVKHLPGLDEFRLPATRFERARSD